MYSYASRVAPDDRWRIAAYIRALQLSQDAPPNVAADSMARRRRRTRWRNEVSVHAHADDFAVPEIRLGAKAASIERISGVVGGLGLLLCVAGFFANRAEFFQSYLFAFIYWSGFTFGGLGRSAAEQHCGRPVGRDGAPLSRSADAYAAVDFSVRRHSAVWHQGSLSLDPRRTWLLRLQFCSTSNPT